MSEQWTLRIHLVLEVSVPKEATMGKRLEVAAGAPLPSPRSTSRFNLKPIGEDIRVVFRVEQPQPPPAIFTSVPNGHGFRTLATRVFASRSWAGGTGQADA